MDRIASSPNRSRLLLPVLAVLLLTTMALVSYVALASDEVEQACVEQQIHTRAAVATRLRVARSNRTVVRGALVAAPRDQQDVRWMVEYCDTATSRDVLALRDVALTAESPLAAANAVRALGRLHAVAKDPEVVKLLGDARPRVRDETILALGESRDAAASELLEPLVRSEDPHVRVLAIHALGRAGGERARRILGEVAGDPGSTSEMTAFAGAGLAASGR